MNIYLSVFLWSRCTFYVNKGLIALGMEEGDEIYKKGKKS